MKDLLELFYLDHDLNQPNTLVRGDCFCEMMVLFVNLAESMRLDLFQQVKDLGQFK